MLKNLNGNSKNFLPKLNFLLKKRRFNDTAIHLRVKQIINDVKKNRDKSLIKFEKKFSLIKLSKKGLALNNSEINNIIRKIDKKTKKSIDLAFQRIKNFHNKQQVKSFNIKDKYKNYLAYESKPLNSVGVYVPGGNASYPSSVLMNCIPALLAGVRNIYISTPFKKNEINPAVIYAAKKCKVKTIYKIGGAQAIAAFAYGTETIKKVDKIVGPGNQYVMLAKKEVFGDVGIDMVAGPSEVTIVADSSTNPKWIASDLLAQAEHDKFSQSILISNSEKVIKDVNTNIKLLLKKLPKKKIAEKSIKNFGYSIFCKSKKNTIDIINEIAPEHLEVCLKDTSKIIKNIKNAGSIFLGKYSPEAMGDYLAGPNHVLPTSGAAKYSSGLSVYDFLKRRSIIKITKTGIESLGPSVINLAKNEKLYGHANSVKVRIDKD